MKRKIKLFVLIASGLLVINSSVRAEISENDVAIQKVISSTRAQLGELASSSQAKKIAELMKKFDTQYKNWSDTCGGTFDPKNADPTCKTMAKQMRQTGIDLYGELATYLPSVKDRYDKGSQSSYKILSQGSLRISPVDLYQKCVQGVSASETGKNLVELDPSDPSSPFLLDSGDVPDFSGEMFEVLEQILPSFDNQLPAEVVAGTSYVKMIQNAKMAGILAQKFERAKLMLEAKEDYNEIVFESTKAIKALPKVLGIQYGGTTIKSKPNQRVLSYFNKGGKKATTAKPTIKGLKRRK